MLSGPINAVHIHQKHSQQEEKKLKEEKRKEEEAEDEMKKQKKFLEEKQAFEAYALKLISDRRAQKRDAHLLEKVLEKERSHFAGTKDLYKSCHVNGVSLPSVQRSTTQEVKVKQEGQVAKNLRLGLVW